MKLLEVEKNESMKQNVYRNLKYNIMSLTLKPGEKISESELQKIFNVSKSPIREALVKLKEEKLIEVIPQKGTFISKINLKLVESTLFIRKVVENEALYLAKSSKKNKEDLIKKLNRNFLSMKSLILTCEKTENLLKLFELDKEFHKIIFEHIDKKEVWDTITSSSTHYERFRVLETPELNNILFILEQHQRIIDLLKNNKKVNISFIQDLHVKNFTNSFENLLNKYPDYFFTIPKEFDS